MKLLPILLLLPPLLLAASCDDDDDDDDLLGLMVEIPRDGKFDRNVIVKRVAIVRGTVVSATGIPVVGAQIRITVFLVDIKFRHLVFEDRCKSTLTHFSTSTSVAGEFQTDLRVDSFVPELCIVVTVVPPTLSGLRPTIVRVESVLPVLNTGFTQVPVVVVNVILTT